MSTRFGSSARPTTRDTLSAAGAVLLTSTAFSGILADARWVVPSVLIVATIAGVGVAARTLRWWPPFTVLAQLAAVLVLLVTQFSSRAVLGVLPSSTALSELVEVLASALNVVRTGVPPVPADPAIQCLVGLGLGLIAVLVDAIAVTVGTPAVAGLVLLCVFALPASLSENMLPWWTFVASAAGFAVLLLSNGRDESAQQPTSTEARLVLSRQSVVVAATATVIALLTGSMFTGVGTKGQLPGSDTTGFGAATEGIGLRPFTSLRGQLNRDRVVELFRVRGLPEDAYLRAMTLRKFDPARGWELDGLTQGVDANGPLPLPEATLPPAGPRVQVEITPTGFRDPWLPAFGVPLEVSGMGPDWRYDPAAGILFTQKRQESKPYSEQLVLAQPSSQQLRAANGPYQVEPAYTDTRGVPQEITDLAHRVTANAPTRFDKAVALNRLFTDPSNGFSYTLNTAPATSGDALSDFLFRGKRGYCEQFASSMAVLLRSIDIPARVAVGFTPGYREGGERVITTQDAHAWVEAYFPGVGWTTFDPTPLDDGRGSQPSYLDAANPAQPAPPPPGESQTAPPPPEQAEPGQPTDDPRDEAYAPQRRPGAVVSTALWSIFGLGVLVLALTAAPAVVRELRRRRRVQSVANGGSGAADIAWREILDESWDRGTRPSPTHTAREVASNLIERHDLDEDGARAMHKLVTAVERDWYAPAGRPADPSVPELLSTALSSVHRNAPLSVRDRLLPRSVLHDRTPWDRLVSTARSWREKALSVRR